MLLSERAWGVEGEKKNPTCSLEAAGVCRLGSLGEGSGARQPLAAGADEVPQPWERWDARLLLPWVPGEPRGTHGVLAPSLPPG